ncbi:MAG: hypothetical protein OEU26_21045 [Candidatus Tectomicrobia bacterium]|nr:hypothetical protein [Candidatus Tectomicrobia bacterium]
MSRLPAADRGNEPTTIAGGRLSKCQPCRLEAEVSRSDRLFSSRHPSLVEVLDNANGNLRHRLRLLEAQGLVEIGRSPQGQAESVRLHSEGRQKASEIAESFD